MASQEEAEVVLAATKKGSAAWRAAFNSGDAAGCAAMYEDDAVMNAKPFGTFTGKKEIEEFWTKLIADGYSKVMYMESEIDIVDSKTAVLKAAWTMNKASGIITKELWALQDDGNAKLREDDFEAIEEEPKEFGYCLIL